MSIGPVRHDIYKLNYNIDKNGLQSVFTLPRILQPHEFFCPLTDPLRKGYRKGSSTKNYPTLETCLYIDKFLQSFGFFLHQFLFLLHSSDPEEVKTELHSYTVNPLRGFVLAMLSSIGSGVVSRSGLFLARFLRCCS